MYQAVLPKAFRRTWFQDRPPNVELDYRNSLTRNLYGCWLLGNGPPTNLVRMTENPKGTIVGNYGHGSYSASGTPVHTVDFHGGPSDNWVAGNEGIDLSVPSAFAIERTESFTLFAHLSANVTRSGSPSNYTIWANTGDVVGGKGIRWQLIWFSPATNQRLTLTSTVTTSELQVLENVDTQNGASVLGVTYDGTSTPGGVNFFHSGTYNPATSVTNTLTTSIIPATAIPAIGRRTLSGAVAQAFKGKLATVFLWRGRVLTVEELQEMDTEFQQLFLVPSYRRWSIPAAPAVPDLSALTPFADMVGRRYV